LKIELACDLLYQALVAGAKRERSPPIVILGAKKPFFRKNLRFFQEILSQKPGFTDGEAQILNKSSVAKITLSWAATISQDRCANTSADRLPDLETFLNI
jgi:hypothetical protein